MTPGTPSRSPFSQRKGLQLGGDYELRLFFGIFPSFGHRYLWGHWMTDLWALVTGRPSNEVHVSIDVGNSTKAMRRGLPRTMTINKHSM